MTAHPARRSAPPRAPERLDRDPAHRGGDRIERRRRESQFRRLRRDALVDAGIAVLLMTFTLNVTAGLGVVAILEVPVGAVVIGSFVIERLWSRR